MPDPQAPSPFAISPGWEYPRLPQPLDWTRNALPAGGQPGEVLTVGADGTFNWALGTPGPPGPAGSLGSTTEVPIGGSFQPGFVLTVGADGKLTAVDMSYTFTFSRRATGTVWNIPHNLNQLYVLVQVIDSTGKQVIGDVEFIDNNNCRVTFANSVTGTAIIRR